MARFGFPRCKAFPPAGSERQDIAEWVLKNLSCRTGPLLVGRSLRDFCTGRSEDEIRGAFRWSAR
jgi:hypothetical protein